MKRYFFFTICIMLGLLSAMASDSVKICGLVMDAITGDPIGGVIVKSNGAFTSTDRDGRFVISPKAGTDSILFRCIGYNPLTLPLTADFSEVRLYHTTTRLRDVVVEAPDIYAKGDTLVFNVDRYANAKDNAIIDVIKRLPGIKVKEDGTIEYQGKPINKFYIDGNDFIGGQYGLATNNISHKDVKSVEVMEKHQPVKALEGIEFPDEAGINLKLKDDARGRWVGVAQAAAGVQPFLYDGSLFNMRMASKIQNMFTLKADNTGWNPANEIREHDFNDLFSSDYSSSLWQEYISADMITAPLSEKRTRDNLSWLANAITAWKSGDTSMRLNLNYMADRLDYQSGLITDYFSNHIPTFIQNNSQRVQSHNISAQIYSETNKRGYYLKDKLTLSATTDRSISAITGSFNLEQRVNRRNFLAQNDLKLVKRNDRKLFTLTSRNVLGCYPDRLLVSGEENAIQSLGTVDFRSSTETRFGKLQRFCKYYVIVGLDLNYHRLKSTLNGLGIYDNANEYEAFLTNLYFSPQADYERNGWRISLRSPLKWCHYAIDSRHDYINASPRFSVWRQLAAKSEISGSVAYQLGSPLPYLNIDVPLLSDYRNLFIAVNPDKYTQDLAVSLSYRYRNAIKALFFNLYANFNYHRSHLMPNQMFVDDFIISTFVDKLYNSEAWYLKGNFSKGLGHSRMVVGVELASSLSSASSMRDNCEMSYRQITAGVKPYLKGSLLRSLSINYEAEYGYSRLIIDAGINNYHTFRQNLTATAIPNDYLQFTIGAEQFLTQFPEGNTANLILVDASTVWRINNKIRLSIAANNLLNKRSYEYINYGTLSWSQHTFRIRQRSILASIQYRF